MSLWVCVINFEGEVCLCLPEGDIVSAAIARKVPLAVFLPCQGVENGLFEFVQRVMIPPVLGLAPLDVALALEMPRRQRDLDIDTGDAIGYSLIDTAVY